MEIKDIVIKSELIDWQAAQWIQANLKELTKQDYDKLRESLIQNNFMMPFTVWQDGDTLWILDGHHRQKVLQTLMADGYTIPERLPANFIECKDKHDAAKKVLIYSSIYAKITDDGLYELISQNEIDFEEVKKLIDLPNVNLDYFEEYYIKDNPLTVMENEPVPSLVGNSTETLRVVIVFKNEEEENEFYELLKIEKGAIAREYSAIREKLLRFSEME